ncbi:MAG: ATP-dependent DNA ligase, partial [Actinomycetota bacterium]|nr:ATP-dependent DNA ligase [Actinomycetota bacterium]
MSEPPVPLADYRSMRDFRETPEPAGELGPVPPPSPDGTRFVVQEHHATSLHWDLRLERHGVLVSWALPKGVPPDPRVNHLAVHTEDHPLQYLTFHGEIPAGNYGAGSMTVWDTGTYETEKWDDREVMVVFHGSRVNGRHVLFQTRGNQWMIHRMDPPEDPGREVWPGWSAFEPMLAVPADPRQELPAGPFG